MSLALSRRALLIACLTLAIGCTSAARESEAVPQKADPPSSREAQLIDHVLPRRDSTGPAPKRFEWTAAKGADEYAIGLWNESDMILWRQGGFREPSATLPSELVLEPGTYYWSVVAERDGRPIAESGLSAFVVMPQP
jgi:hypothetical protein